MGLKNTNSIEILIPFIMKKINPELTKDLRDMISTNSTNISNLQLKLLWENSSPTSVFAAQDITLSSDDYDYLVWFYKSSRNDTSLQSVTAIKGYGVTLFAGGTAHVSGSSSYVGSVYNRKCTYKSDTVYTVPSSSVSVGNSTTSGSDATTYCVPIFIYGGKFN